MARPHSITRSFIALFLLGVVAATCVALGIWQLDRAAQRDAILAAIETGQNMAPLQLTAQTPDEAMQSWRAATATGTWLPELTVLLMNRNYKGQSGFWVTTPLLLHDEPGTAVLVLRGWMPRSLQSNASQPDVPAQPGVQTVQGQLLSHVPRLFELWTFGGSDPSALPEGFPDGLAAPPMVQNLSLASMEQASGLKLLPIVLEQTTPNAPAGHLDPLVRDWPAPPLDAATNRGYALQWFGFATIALLAFAIVAWRGWRRHRQRVR